MEKLTNWFNSLSVRSKLMFVTYANLAILMILALVFSLIVGQYTVIIIVLSLVAAGIAYPIVIFTENAITSSFDEIRMAANSISKGDFTQTIDTEATNAGELGHTFNS